MSALSINTQLFISVITDATSDRKIFQQFYLPWSEFLATNPGVRVGFPELPDFLRSSVSGTGSTQPREYN
jgi:hypothetical protein